MSETVGTHLGSLARLVPASGGDVCVYGPPLLVQGATTFVRRSQPWTVESLASFLPTRLGTGQGPRQG